MKYLVKWNYKSSYGTFVAGETVEMSEEQAEVFSRDSPGVLEALTPDLTPGPSPEVGGGKKDRQVKKANVRGGK